MQQLSLGATVRVPQEPGVPQSGSDASVLDAPARVRPAGGCRRPGHTNQIRRNAETTLHEIEAFSDRDRRDEGFEGETLWHRGWTHEQELRKSWLRSWPMTVPGTMLLFYKRAVGLAEFEILAVRSLQIADCIWEQVQTGS